MYRQLPKGAVPGIAPICLDSNDPATIEDGFAARVLRNVDIDDEFGAKGIFARQRVEGIKKLCPKHPKELKEFEDFVISEVTKLPKVDVGSVDFEKWVSSRDSYNENRKNQLRKEFEQLRGGHPSRRQCQSIASFVKSESYPAQKHARMINSRSDAFKAWAGPYVSAMEEIVYSHCPEFIKHTPVHERPAKIAALKQANMRYYSTDFTAFESHFLPEVMESCENILYRYLLQDWDGIDLLCSTNAGTNRMRTRSGVKAKCEGRRMSGDLWTSLGNGFTNLMLAKFLAWKQGKVLMGFVEGDDGLFATEAEQFTAALYKRMYGFDIKLIEVLDPCSASFCGMIFADSGQIIRDPVRFLQTFGWTQSFIEAGPKVMHELLLAKCLSAIQETPHCPIVGAIARECMKVCEGYHPRFIRDGYHQFLSDLSVPNFAPSEETRMLFQASFGVSCDDQVELEAQIRRGDFSNIADVLNVNDDIRRAANIYVEET